MSVIDEISPNWNQCCLRSYIGGIFVAETLSVMLQIGYFRLTGGGRLFKCAPIHHHFHLVGWTEQQVVGRFWLLSAIFAVVALGSLKLR